MANEINALKDNPAPATPAPVILTVPGLGNSGPGHWQTEWEARLPRCRRVDLGLWEDPHRNTWVNKLNLAIQRAEGPVVLAAHSLGCHAVAWWAEYEQPRRPVAGGPVEAGTVIGALLVAPPDVEDRPLDRRLTRFAPVPEAALPFPAIVVASRNDPYLTMTQARHLAREQHAVDVLQEVLVLDLRVREEEGHGLAQVARGVVHGLKVLLERVHVVRLGERDLEQAVARNVGGEARERLLARAAHAHEQRVAARQAQDHVLALGAGALGAGPPRPELVPAPARPAPDADPAA